MTAKNNTVLVTAIAVVVKANDCYKMEGTLGGTALVQIYGGFSLKDLDMSSGVSFRKTSSYLARKRLRLSQFALMFEQADTLA